MFGDTVGSLLRLVFITEIDVLWGHELVSGYELDISIRVDSYLPTLKSCYPEWLTVRDFLTM